MDLNNAGESQPQLEWDLSGLARYSDQATFEFDQTAALATAEVFAGNWNHRLGELTDPAVLAEALQAYEQWFTHYDIANGVVGDSGVYWKLRSLQDSGDQQAAAKLAKTETNAQTIKHLFRPFTLAIERIPPESRQQLLAAPQLTRYRSVLERMFQTAPKPLSTEQEAELAITWQETRYNHIIPLSKAISTADRFTYLPGDRNGPQSTSALLSLMSDPDEDTRTAAATAFNQLLLNLAGQATEEMRAVTGHWRREARLRGYKRPDQKRLIQDHLPGGVVDSLLATVAGRYDLSRRFYQIMANVRGVDQIKYHERFLPLGNFQQTFTWPEAWQLISQTYTSIDEQFGETVKQVGRAGLIDVHPRLGKPSIEQCNYFTPGLPPFVTLLFRGKPLDVVVSAHELAHALHIEWMRPHRSNLEFGLPPWMIELPAVFIERFFWDRLMQDADPETRFALLAERCSRLVALVLRQVAGYQFEQDIHKIILPTTHEISHSFSYHMAAYMGPAVEQSPFSQYWWVQWSHLRQPFSNTAYPVGMLAATTMHARLNNDPGYLSRVKEFLTLGLTASFTDAFKVLDLDLDGLWVAGLAEVEALLDELENLGQRLGRIQRLDLAAA